MKQIRQGDILLKAVDKTPPAGITAKSKVVLAEGELTGHMHVLTATEIQEWVEGDKRYVRVLGDRKGEISHEDHDPNPVAVVDVGVTYEVIPQKETNLAGMWQPVVD